MNYSTKVLNKVWLTHDVLLLSIEKPRSFKYKLGQAVEIALHKDTNFLKAPFTITSNYEKDADLQFIIKVYTEHYGITIKLAQLVVNDQLWVSDAWDAFIYNGPGVFIAAGSGITPFIPRLRLLKQQDEIDGHQLIFANKKAKDIILRNELKEILGNEFYNILSRDHLSECAFGHIDRAFLHETIKALNQNFYLCGPMAFLNSTKKHLKGLGIKKDQIQIIY